MANIPVLAGSTFSWTASDNPIALSGWTVCWTPNATTLQPTTSTPTTSAPTTAPVTSAPTPAPPTHPPTLHPTNPGECARNCGVASRGGGTCRTNGRCLSCNDNRVLQSGRCYSAIACKGRRIQTGSQVGSNCRCLDGHCHYCNRVVAGDTCRVCRDGYYLLDAACVAACPADMASMGIGQFKRRCMAPFTCRSARLVVEPLVSFGCKCANEDNTGIADCQICEHRAGEHGQYCTKCNAGKFLHNNRCVDDCDGTGLITYTPGNCEQLLFASFSGLVLPLRYRREYWVHPWGG